MLLLCLLVLGFVQGTEGITIDLAPFNTSAVIGGNATLACLVSNQGSDRVKWYVPGNLNALTVDDTITTSGDHYQVSGKYNLTIVGVTNDDEGEYRCEAGSNNYYGSLTVVVLPNNVTAYWSSTPTASSTANITCYASRAHPPPTAFAWFKNNVALDTSNAIYTSTSDSSGYGEAYSTLPVYLTSNDEGAVFRCEADYPDYNDAVNANLTTALSGSTRPVVFSLALTLLPLLLTLLR